MLSALFWETYFRVRKFRTDWEDIDRALRLSPAAARSDMASRLLRHIRYFGARGDALPEWREAAAIRDPEQLWKIWPELPIVTRRDLQTRFHAREIRSRFAIAGVVSSTGGSTGEPTPYLHDAAMLRSATAARAYCRGRFGWRPGMATIAVWGSERDIGRASSVRGRLSARLRRDRIVDGYSLGPETVERFHQTLRGCQPAAVFGFTSMLEFVARETLRRGLETPAGSVTAAWNGGEMLYPEQAEVFQKAFGCPLLNLYGSRELSATAYQPGLGQPLTILRPLVFLEVVNDRNRPAAEGESGRLILTSTVCRGTPFLRYECGDLGSFSSSGADESGIRQLHQLHGRTAGLLRLSNGRIINNIFWNHLFKEFGEVEQFQVALRRDRQVELRLKGRGLPPAEEERVRQTVRNVLSGMPVTIRWVSSIPRTAQGKLEQVVRES